VTLVSIVVATDERGAIGRDGRLPWHLPDDLRRFKALTMGKPIVMGRKTWESIGRPLPGRQNIVVTRQPGFQAAGATIVSSLEDALAAAANAAEICVIGGAEVYRLALPHAQLIYLTRVHAMVEADTYFPPVDAAHWEQGSREDHAADERHVYPYSFLELHRIAGSAALPLAGEVGREPG
jgi:dihydrofolate reductase